MTTQGKKASLWHLVRVADRAPVPGVVEARQQWEKKQVMVRLPSGQWRRGVVLLVRNDGDIIVGVCQDGRVAFAVSVPFDGASRLLHMATSRT